MHSKPNKKLRGAACILSFLIPSSPLADELENPKSISTLGNAIVIVGSAGRKQQVIMTPSPIERDDVALEDVNFDGYGDIKITREKGATQIFYEIYLYTPKSKEYVFNKEMSDIPCLQSDRERRLLIGTCYHISACENWIEKYEIKNGGFISLVEKKGTHCNPSGDSAYSYVEFYKDGTMTSSESRLLPRD